MNYKDIKTNEKMNRNVKDMLLLKGDNISLYALKRINELENNTVVRVNKPTLADLDHRDVVGK